MFNLRLKEARREIGLTQTEFAAGAGVKMRTVQDWEKGISTPTIKQLAALADADVDIVYVLTGIKVSEATRKNIALMLKVTADVDPAGQGELSKLAVTAALDVASAADKASKDAERLRAKIEVLDESGRSAVEAMVDALLTKK